MIGNILEGDGKWPYTATDEDPDVSVDARNVPPGTTLMATWFGGADDPQDDGETASGVNTKLDPDCHGCALARNIGALCPETDGSPIPPVPYGSRVSILAKSGAHITLPLIDIGPAKGATTKEGMVHLIDLTPAAFKALGGDLAVGWIAIDRIRIVGGAKYIGQ